MNTPYQEALGSTLISRGIREKIVLVAVTMPDRTDDETQDSLDETWFRIEHDIALIALLVIAHNSKLKVNFITFWCSNSNH